MLLLKNKSIKLWPILSFKVKHVHPKNHLVVKWLHWTVVGGSQDRQVNVLWAVRVFIRCESWLSWACALMATTIDASKLQSSMTALTWQYQCRGIYGCNNYPHQKSIIMICLVTCSTSLWPNLCYKWWIWKLHDLMSKAEDAINLNREHL